jgi:peptidoglycan/xylan/chitin deacetylase (PgdA/CDA1 family)
MKQSLLKLVLAVLDFLGFNYLFKLLNAGKFRVLMYHSVTSQPLPSCYWTRLTPDTFTWQMEYLQRHYRVVPAAELLDDRRIRQSQEKHRVVITFDDGLENTYREVWPVLKSRRLTAVVFVLPALSESGRFIWADELYGRLIATETKEFQLSEFGLGCIHLDSNPRKRADQIEQILLKVKSWPPHKRQALMEHVAALTPNWEPRQIRPLKLMSREQVIELAHSREFHIGGHTDTHPILSTLPTEQQQQEIFGCLERLGAWGINHLPLFAYPNGRLEDFTQKTIGILKQANIKGAVTTIDGLHNPGDDPYYIKRIAIGAEISRAEFKARLSGLYYFLKRIADTRKGKRTQARKQDSSGDGQSTQD